MYHVDSEEITKLLDTIQTCEIAVSRLKNNPPKDLGFKELAAYKEEFNRLGARSLVEYYRLTSPLFQNRVETT